MAGNLRHVNPVSPCPAMCEGVAAAGHVQCGICVTASSQPATTPYERLGINFTVCHAYVRANRNRLRVVHMQLLGLYGTFGSKVVRSTPAFLVGGKLVGALSREDKGLLGSGRDSSNSTTAGGGGGDEGVGRGAAGRGTSGLQKLVRLATHGDLDLRAVIRELLGKASTQAAGGGTARKPWG